MVLIPLVNANNFRSFARIHPQGYRSLATFFWSERIAALFFSSVPVSQNQNAPLQALPELQLISEQKSITVSKYEAPMIIVRKLYIDSKKQISRPMVSHEYLSRYYLFERNLQIVSKQRHRRLRLQSLTHVLVWQHFLAA